MKLALTMPQFGESITQALIVRWLKKEGEEVKEQEPLIEMETEKAVFSYESPFRGKLVKILHGENEQVAVGVEIAQFEIAEELGKKYLSMGIGQGLGSVPPAPPSPASVPQTSAAPPSQGSALPPLIRSLAKEHGVPLEEVEQLAATRPGGRVTKEDFLQYLDKGKEGGEVSSQRVKEVPLTPIRARIAEKMSLSKREIPHAGTGLDVDVTSIDEWRKKGGSKIGYLPFVFVSVLKALKKFPILNSSLKQKDGRPWIEEYPFVHLGIATATPQGLMVPVLKNAHQLSFRELLEQSERLIEKGRSGRLEVAELTGATFTVNNTGALGALRSLQIIPHPQSGILAVNRVVRRPWVVDGEVKVRSILSLDLAFDHRIVDGEAACGFLVEVQAQLERFDFSLV